MVTLGQVFELPRRRKQTDFLIAKSLEAFVKEVPFHKKTDPLHSWQHVEDFDCQGPKDGISTQEMT